MSRTFVGYDVGLHVGFLTLPDIDLLKRFNNISAICRKCRVSEGGETPYDSLLCWGVRIQTASERSRASQDAHIVGLE
jgi:hypothetical protein